MMFVPTFQPKSKLKKEECEVRGLHQSSLLSSKSLEKRKETMTTPSFLLMSLGEKFFNSLNSFPLPETHTKATAHDGRDRSCARREKGGKIRPGGTIARAGMRSPFRAPRPVLLAVAWRNRRRRGSRCSRVLNARQHDSSPVRFFELKRGEIGANERAD
jgi:hypothetical protein